MLFIEMVFYIKCLEDTANASSFQLLKQVKILDLSEISLDFFLVCLEINVI